jgi:hypothetical protein
MLSPDHAMQLLDARLGITVGKSTFYRWILAGRFFSIRLGGKIYIPLSEMEIAMERLRRGEKLWESVEKHGPGLVKTALLTPALSAYSSGVKQPGQNEAKIISRRGAGVWGCGSERGAPAVAATTVSHRRIGEKLGGGGMGVVKRL